MKTVLRYRSYAKLNLFLEVVSRRPDGYHELETVFQTVGLYDELTFESDCDDIILEGTSVEVPSGQENIVLQAAKLLSDRYDVGKGVRITLDKRIPVAAGLAGGSGNAAATLTALNVLWQLGLDAATLHALALELGSDVPYCLVGGTVAATGRGEQLESLPALAPTWFVLVHPQLHMSTAAVFNHPDLNAPATQSENDSGDAFVACVRAIRAGEALSEIHNRLEEIVFAEHSELEAVKQGLLDAGCSVAGMSGSGPTIFGICASQSDADAVVRDFSEFSTSVVQSVDVGVERVT